MTHSEEGWSASSSHRPIFDLGLPAHKEYYDHDGNLDDHDDDDVDFHDNVDADDDDDDDDDDDTHLAKSSADSIGLSIRSTVRKAA